MPGNGLVPVAAIRYGQETTVLSHGNFCSYRTWLYLTFRTKFVILDHCVSAQARTLMWCQSLQWVSTCKALNSGAPAHIQYWAYLAIMCSVKVQVMWRRALFTYQDYVITPILLLLASSHEISMRTCVLSNYPGHAWGGDSTQEHRCEDSPSDTGSLQKPFSTLQLLEYVPLSFPQNVAHLLLLFSSLWFCLVSHTKPSLKLMLFLFPGLKPQTLLFSAVSLACNTSVSFFPFSFFKRHFKLHK